MAKIRRIGHDHQAPFWHLHLILLLLLLVDVSSGDAKRKQAATCTIHLGPPRFLGQKFGVVPWISMYIVQVAACFRLVSPLDFQQQQEEDAKRVPDGHGQSFGSWPWQKLLGFLIVALPKTL